MHGYENWMKKYKNEDGNVIKANCIWNCQKIDSCGPKWNVDSYAWMNEQDANALVGEWNDLGQNKSMTVGQYSYGTKDQ